jgi:hypothetical protein
MHGPFDVTGGLVGVVGGALDEPVAGIAATVPCREEVDASDVDAVVLLDQHPADQVQWLLGAPSHQHVPRAGVHRSGHHDVRAIAVRMSDAGSARGSGGVGRGIRQLGRNSQRQVWSGNRRVRQSDAGVGR